MSLPKKKFIEQMNNSRIFVCLLLILRIISLSRLFGVCEWQQFSNYHENVSYNVWYRESSILSTVVRGDVCMWKLVIMSFVEGIENCQMCKINNISDSREWSGGEWVSIKLEPNDLIRRNNR